MHSTGVVEQLHGDMLPAISKIAAAANFACVQVVLLTLSPRNERPFSYTVCLKSPVS